MELGIYKYSETLENLGGALNWIYQKGCINFPNGKWGEDVDYFKSLTFGTIFIDGSISTQGSETITASNIFPGETITASIRHLGFVSVDCYLRIKISSTNNLLIFNLSGDWFESDGYYYYSSNNIPKVFLTNDNLDLSFTVNIESGNENVSENKIQLIIETLQAANVTADQVLNIWKSL